MLLLGNYLLSVILAIPWFETTFLMGFIQNHKTQFRTV